MGASVQSTAGSRGVRISGSNAGYTMFRGSMKSTGYLLHSPVSPSLTLPCVNVWHHISTGLYHRRHINCEHGDFVKWGPAVHEFVVLLVRGDMFQCYAEILKLESFVRV